MHILKGINPWFWSKFLNIFQVYFSVKETLVLSFDDVVFSKGGFLDDKNDILLWSKNLHIVKGVNPWFWSKFLNIFQVYFSVKETLALSFNDFFFSKGTFLDDKNTKQLKIETWHIVKGVNPWFWSRFLNIFQVYFSVKESLVFSFDDVVFSRGGFLDDKNDILLWSKTLHIVKGVNPWLWWKFLNIFLVYFSVKETLALWFDDLFFSKGAFWDDKNTK